MGAVSALIYKSQNRFMNNVIGIVCDSPFSNLK